MVKRKSTVRYMLAGYEEQENTQGGAHTRSASTSTTFAAPLPTSSSTRPAKRKRTAVQPVSSPLTPLGSSSSDEANEVMARPTVEQPRVSLARLPLDILLRVGQFILPTVHLTNPDGSATRSPSWVDPGADLVRFTSTCRAAWQSSRHLIGRYFGVDLRFSLSRFPARLIERRLKCIVSDEEYDQKMADARKTSPVEAPYTLSKEFRPVQVHELIPASRVRHLYIAVSSEAEAFTQVGILRPVAVSLARTLPLLTSLKSLAIVWCSELEVVETSPYSVLRLPSEILLALAAHSSLRDLFLCGVKFSRRNADGYSSIPDDDSIRFGTQLETITANACHDSALELITMAPGLKEVRAWRDYSRAPRVNNEFWWMQENWKKVERVDLTGFSGQQGRELLDWWRSELGSLRSLSPPVSIPLHSLRLSEPYTLSTLRDEILPAFANLPNLKHFSCVVWGERSFGPTFLDKVYNAIPDLETLGIAYEHEALNWWQGNLVDYAADLKRFKNLHTFTWNYSPYAELDYPDTRKHVYPMLLKSFFHPSLSSPTFRTLRWHGESVELRRIDRPFARSEWLWSDDPLFDRPLPRWAVFALQENKRALKPVRRRVRHPLDSDCEDDSDAEVDRSSEEDETANRALQRYMAAEAEQAKARWGGQGKGKARASSSSAVEVDKENDADQVAAAASSSSSSLSAFAETSSISSSAANAKPFKRRGPRKSLTELLHAAKAESVRKGKQKAVEQDEDGLEGAGDDSGFFEMPVADL
ncbi:hypothetical protein JCM8547_006531 [Rhodosporidiobolus lusitaniae]